MTKWLVVSIGAFMALSYRPAIIASEPTTTKHLSVSTSTSTPSVAPGGRVSLVVEVTPKPNMHVYAPGQDDVIPISLTLKPGDATAAKPVQFPPPEKLENKELGETQLVYSRPFRLVQDVTIPSSRSLVKRAASRDPSLALSGVLKYQACDNTICYAPVSVPVTWTVALLAETPHDVKKPR
jgi:DsbC/DsbD-like thiol-disulfide interchange protein